MIPLHRLTAAAPLIARSASTRARGYIPLSRRLLAIFGFFRCYPMYLVDEFRLNVSPQVSEFVAWLAVPIVIANLWLTDFLAVYGVERSGSEWGCISGIVPRFGSKRER